jgi:DNA-binding transcriptional LysR family regulator
MRPIREWAPIHAFVHGRWWLAGADSFVVTDQTPQALAAALAPRLALLRAVAEEGTLTRAAARLGMPQPTASRWLAAVGAELGAPVLVRDGRGVRLSAAGAALAAGADRALGVLESACRQVVTELDPERGRVVFAFLHTMGGVRVPELLRAFRAEHPGVRFELVQGAHGEILEHLRSGRADLALTSPLPTGPEFAHAELYRQALVVTVPTGHRLAGRRRVRIAELAGEAFVGMKTGYGLRLITDELCRAAGFVPDLAFEGEEVDTVRGLVAAGLGVAVLPAAAARTSGVVELTLRAPATRVIGLVWPVDRPLSPAADTFRAFATAQRQHGTDQPKE